MNPDYKMRFAAEVTMQRYQDFTKGLLDHDDILMFFQDMVERQCLPDVLYSYAVHLSERGLIHTGARQVH